MAARTTPPLLVRSSDSVDADAAVAGCSFRTHAVTKPCRAPIHASMKAGPRPCMPRHPLVASSGFGIARL